MGSPYGLSRKSKFSFEKFKTFQADTWQKLIDEAMEKEKSWESSSQKLRIFGFDKSGLAIKDSQHNSKSAGLDHIISFSKNFLDEVKNPCPDTPGVLVLNPPYGERLDSYELQDLYRDLGFTLKQEFGGWMCWILSGDSELTQYLGLKSMRKIPVWNGSIECRWIQYKIRSF